MMILSQHLRQCSDFARELNLTFAFCSSLERQEGADSFVDGLAHALRHLVALNDNGGLTPDQAAKLRAAIDEAAK